MDELAAATGERVERLADWVALGLIDGADDRYPQDAVERARLIGYASQRGIAPEVIAAASVEQGDILARYLELGGGPGIRTSHRLTDAAALAGLDESLFRRLWLASGLRDQNDASEADIEMLRVAAGALEAGMPIDALLQIIRVLNDSLTRVAEAENRLFHYYVHERLRAEGLAGAALVAATEEVSGPLLGLMEPALLYFHSKAWQRALRDDLVVHLAEDVGGAGDAIGQVSVTVLFIDLARYTAMTEAMGDLAAATVIERFSDLVREAASGYDGRVLKQVGDEFMLVFRDSPSAISCGLSVMAMTAREAQFPDVRLGAHAGPALYREGDYVGATINLAARVTSEAERGQFLVTESMKLADPDGTVSFVSVGLRSMKNVGEPVELFEVDSAERAERPVDPVCGMAIDPASATASIDWHGREILFCSGSCRQRFLDVPDRYLS